MDNLDTKTKNPLPRVQFSIENGVVKFSGENLREYEVNDTLQGFAKYQQETWGQLQELRQSNTLLMHTVVLLFMVIASLTGGFVVSRIVSSSINSGQVQEVTQ